jgi:hypothetical protein
VSSGLVFRIPKQALSGLFKQGHASDTLMIPLAKKAIFPGIGWEAELSLQHSILTADPRYQHLDGVSGIS